MERSLIIAIDFDGTCVEHCYPAIGCEVDGAVEVLRALQQRGHRLILHTVRSGATLEAAISWFQERRIPLWGVNLNIEQRRWSESPKVYAHYYIDDSALGCPIRFIDDVRRPVVDWRALRKLLEYHGIL